MNRWLLLRDPATHNLRTAALVAAATGLIIRVLVINEGGAGLFDTSSRGGIWFVYNFSVWSAVLAGLVGSQFWLRAPRLHMALPLSTRRIWLMRMAAVALGCGLMLLLIVAVNGVGWTPGTGPRAVPSAWWGGLRMFSVVLLMLALMQAPEPRLRKLETTPFYVAYTVIVWMLCAAWLLWGPRGLWLTGPTLLAALLIAWTTWRNLPRSFLLDRTEAERDPEALAATRGVDTAEPPPATIAPFRRDGASGPLLHRTLFRVMHNHWTGWLFMGVLVIYGLVLTIHYTRGDDPLIALLYFFVFAFGSWNKSLMRIHAFDAWPVSRRLIFAHAVLPLAVPYLLGMGLGVVIHETQATQMSLVQASEAGVEVPYEFREIAPDGIPPAIVAPWGETHVPTGTRIAPWSDARVYSPYASGPASSARFRNWQADRAVAAIHGDPAPDPLRYAELAADAPPGEGDPCCGFDRDAARGRVSDHRSRTFALVVAMLVLLELPLMLTATMTYDRRALEWVRTRGVFAGALLPMGVLGAMLATTAASDAELWAQGAWIMIGLGRLADALSLTPPQAWLIALGLTAGAYLILQERFTRLEASLTMMRKQRENDF